MCFVLFISIFFFTQYDCSPSRMKRACFILIAFFFLLFNLLLLLCLSIRCLPCWILLILIRVRCEVSPDKWNEYLIKRKRKKKERMNETWIYLSFISIVFLYVSLKTPASTHLTEKMHSNANTHRTIFYVDYLWSGHHHLNHLLNKNRIFSTLDLYVDRN